jgi:predicted amino acid-binding ACT domain protein
MPQGADNTAFVREVSDLYADIMTTLEGASSNAIRAALSMAVVMSGENIGLSGSALVDWIEETGEDAKLALNGRRLD